MKAYAGAEAAVLKMLLRVLRDAEYRRERGQMKELLTVKANVDRLMGWSFLTHKAKTLYLQYFQQFCTNFRPNR